MTPRIELLWWRGCPSTARARAALREALADVGLPGAAITMVEITTDEQAADIRFAGSPTILIDGEDVSPVTDEPAALTCRIYYRRDGKISPAPDPEELREALRRSMARQEVPR